MKFIRKNPTADRVGYSPSHLMRLVREGKFPQPVPLGESSTAVAFVEDEVLEWMQERVDKRGLPHPSRTGLGGEATP